MPVNGTSLASLEPHQEAWLSPRVLKSFVTAYHLKYKNSINRLNHELSRVTEVPPEEQMTIHLWEVTEAFIRDFDISAIVYKYIYSNRIEFGTSTKSGETSKWS